MSWLRLVFLLPLLVFFLVLSGLQADIVTRPGGKVLFQPQLLWSDSMSTVQGTGYMIEHDGKYYGVTSIHFLDFEAGGLRAASWLDVYSEMPLATFRASWGRPARTAITQPRHVADDFLLLPAPTLPEGGTALRLENVERYAAGTHLWFPNKDRDVEIGYKWYDATVVEDAGHLIRVKVRDAISLQSQSGSPLLSAQTGRVVGMIQAAAEENGATILTLCPARSILKHLGRRQQLVSLMTSIRRRR